MPVYIGDYLADTMHLNTEQHGAYLLLLFHLWRRGSLPDDDLKLAQITGLSVDAWSMHRAVLAEFFAVGDGAWMHGRVEQERERIAKVQLSNSAKAKEAASRRWNKSRASDASTIASGIARELPGDAKSESQSYPETQPQLPEPITRTFSLNGDPVKRGGDPRHTPFRRILAAYWQQKNHATPEMPWQGRDAKALSDFLSACPQLTEEQFRQMVENRARSAVAHGDRVFLWIANLTRYQEEISIYNKPASAGSNYASRAEINRNAVVSAVDRALALAREHAGGIGQAGAEPAAFVDPGMPAADGAGPERRSLAVAGSGNPRVAARHAADGPAGTDGPLSHGAATAGAGGAHWDGRQDCEAEAIAR